MESSQTVIQSDDYQTPKGANRRRMLGQFLAAAGCGSLGWFRYRTANADNSSVTIPPVPARKESAPIETPQDALQRLYEGNLRFSQGKSIEEHRDLGRVKEVAAGQKPFAAFLGCADSRVPVEIVFDQGFGDIFVTRIAGNVASSENIGSLEFGTQVLGARVLYVLGHTQCGAVQATMKGEEVPGQISGLFQHIRPAVKASNGDLNLAVEQNVRNQAILLAESSPVISKLVKRGELMVAGGVYDLRTGLVTPVKIEL
ncbi:MAG: carbonic anhydrase [Planctomycetaceae bacterium]|nr:carbonic anhydrase [Planctomycetaceae bacterium]